MQDVWEDFRTFWLLVAPSVPSCEGTTNMGTVTADHSGVAEKLYLCSLGHYPLLPEVCNNNSSYTKNRSYISCLIVQSLVGKKLVHFQHLEDWILLWLFCCYIP
jgi:hypothetical protein